MDIDTIRTILTVAHCENYSEAARALICSPSVISKRIAKAEHELGVELFVRGRKSSRLVPTAACEAVFPDLQAIEDAWLRAQDTATLLSDRASDGTLRIGSLAKFWPTREDAIITDFMAKNRDANVIIVKQSWDPLVKGLLQGRYDLAFLSFNGPLSDLVERNPDTLLDRFDFYLVDHVDQMLLAVGTRFPEAALGEATLEAFRNFSIAFNVDENGDIFENHAAPFLMLARRYGFALNAKPMNTRDESAFRLARAHRLAIPQPVRKVDIEGIGYVRLTDWPTTLSAYCAVPKGRHAPLVVSMIDHLKRQGCTLDSLTNRR